jgi:hypothetical protein
MQWPRLNAGLLPAVIALLLGACAQTSTQAPSMVMRPPPDDLPRIEPEGQVEPEGGPEEADRMADVPGDRSLPSLVGKLEQIDCKAGVEDRHARMALETRGGQVASFAFYSKRRPRTCSLDVDRDTPYVKWRQTAEGATRVQTLHGPILIRTLRDGYEFEFRNVARQKICGMEGTLNGTMTIRRNSAKPECSVSGLLDRMELLQEIAGSRYSPGD